jgi:LysR family glycine cleavage system transcriptional activator
LLPEVSAALGRLTAASELFEAGVPHGLLTVASSVSFAQWYLAPGIKDFMNAHAGARIRLVSTIWPDDFATSNADIEIRFGSRDLVGEGAEQLLPDDLVAVVSPVLVENHQHVRIERQILEELPLIQAVGTADDWKSWSAYQGLTLNRQPALFVDSHGLAVDLARSGAGIALTSSLLAAPCLAEGTLARLDFPAYPARDGYFLAVDADNNSTLADAFVNWLKSEIRKKSDQVR